MKVGSSGSSDDDDYDIEADQINLLRRQNSVRRFSNWVRKPCDVVVEMGELSNSDAPPIK